MDYIKKSLQKLKEDKTYEEIDTRLALGWYVDISENKTGYPFIADAPISRLTPDTKFSLPNESPWIC